jgi:uncharacterized membrane protein
MMQEDKGTELGKIGPIQVLAVTFDRDDAFRGKIREELDKLKRQNFIRLVDATLVHKDDQGKLTVVKESDLTSDEATEYGAVIGALIGLGSGDEATMERSSRAMAEAFHERYEYGLDKEDLEDMAESMPSRSTALMLLIEHLWAIPLRNAMREAGGRLVAQDFLSPEVLVSIGRQIYSG